jgi:hypothetical protein
MLSRSRERANGPVNKALSQGHTRLICIDFYRLNSTCEMTQQPDYVQWLSPLSYKSLCVYNPPPPPALCSLDTRPVSTMLCLPF